jgi:hypothetical protein
VVYEFSVFLFSRFPLFALAVILPLLRKRRAPVKESSSVLKLNRKLLGTSENVQIVDDRAAAQIEEILA